MTIIIEETTPKQKAYAWGVHAFTASGVLLALMTILAISEQNWYLTFVLMTLNIIVDGFDGTLARKASVKDVLPGFDGAMLDNIIDYLTFAFIPAFFVLSSDLITGPFAAFAAGVIVLTSAYQFCQSDAKTDDHYFKGFPSYWNIAIYYLFLLNWPSWGNFTFLMILGVLVFVPIKYIYPSRTLEWRRTTYVMTGLWTLAQIGIIFNFNNPPMWLVWASMSYMFYYAGLSIHLTFKTR